MPEFGIWLCVADIILDGYSAACSTYSAVGLGDGNDGEVKRRVRDISD